jgi:hypothetical protein
MTYLQLVNAILRRLRENEVVTVNQTAYSKMVGDFVNDAKTMVENAYDWTALRREVSFSTVASQSDYTVADTVANAVLKYFVNDDSRSYLEYRPTVWIEQQRIGAVVEGMPTYYTFVGRSNGEATLRLWPTPDNAYALRYYGKFPQSTLTADGDVILAPSTPILHMALGLLARERGETGGTSVAEYFNIADKYLADAVAYDAALHPEELYFTAP